MKVTLEDVEAAALRLRGVIKNTSLDRSLSASKLLGCEVYYKFENEQLTGSFKMRGAYNKISTLNEDEKRHGVVASSAGNHAQAVAYCTQLCGVKSTIVMPENAPIIKINGTREYGAQVVLKGQFYDQAFAHAQKISQETGALFIPPYQDEKVIAGQGTIGLEIFEKVQDLDSIVVPVGGGGLISGTALVLKNKNPKIKVFGVQSSMASGMLQMYKKQNVDTTMNPLMMTIADGVAIKTPSPIMYDSFIKKYVDDMVTVTDDEIAEAILFLIEKAKSVTEGSGAMGLAAAMKRHLPLGQKTCILISGGNIDLNLIAKIIDQGLVKKGSLAEVSVVGPDLPGFLSRITSVIASEKANVLQVHHDRSDLSLNLRETRIKLMIETNSLEHVEQIKKALQKIEGLRLNS